MTAAVAHRIILGCVPDAELSPNARVHWAVKARKTKQLREYVGYAARDQAPIDPLTGPVVLRITVGWPKGRKRHDDDNMVALCKAVIDGMTDAGWWLNDSQVTIHRPIEQQPWGRWEKQGGWLYPHGCMAIDIEPQETNR